MRQFSMATWKIKAPDFKQGISESSGAECSSGTEEIPSALTSNFVTLQTFYLQNKALDH